jgi:hypothetical protein
MFMPHGQAPLTRPAAAALAPNRLLQLSNGQWAYAGAGDVAIAVSNGRTFGAGEALASEMLTGAMTHRISTDGPIAKYGHCYQAANGQVSASPAGRFVGIALEASVAVNQQIEVLPVKSLTLRPTVDHTEDATLTADQSGFTHTTIGATGTVTLTLPPATLGLEFPFRVGAAQELRINPDGTEKISLPSTGVPGAAGKYLTANADGESVFLLCTKAGEWSVMGYSGTWTAEE